MVHFLARDDEHQASITFHHIEKVYRIKFRQQQCVSGVYLFIIIFLVVWYVL